MSRDEARVEPACEQSREDVRFEIGKAVADADPLAASERIVGEGMATSRNDTNRRPACEGTW